MSDQAREHLAIIAEVVQRSRVERAKSGDIYVVWGVVTVICVVATLLSDYYDVLWGFLSWPVLCTVAAGWTATVARRRSLKRETYGTRIEGAAWLSAGAAMFVLVFGGLATQTLEISAIIPVVCCCIGSAMATSGSVYRSTMLKVASGLFFVTAAVCLFLAWQVQYMTFAVVMVLGYIWPGVVLMREDATG